MTKPSVALRAMTPAEFERYCAWAIPQYARAHARSGDVHPRKALAKAKAEYRQLLPEGVRTRNQHLYTVLHSPSGKAIGMLWFDVRRKHGRRKAYLFDIQLDRAQRGKGYGRQMLAALDAEARRLKADCISLHVFGDNRVALGLYESSGYKCMHVNMTKELRR